MNPFTSGDNIALVDGEPDLVYMCLTSILFALLAIHIYFDCSAVTIFEGLITTKHSILDI